MAYEFSNKEEYELLPDGDYEVILDTAEIKKTNDGSKKYVSCAFLIRSDVEQQGKGRRIFDNIWQDKEDQSKFDLRKLHKILLTQGPSGRYSFADDNEVVQFINGLNMIIHIEKRDADEYHEEAYNQIKYLSYKPSKSQPKTLSTTTQTVEVPSYTADVNDLPDIPF